MIAAQASLCGIDPWKLLTERDSFKRSVLMAVSEAAAELEEERDLRRANKIAAQVSEIFKK